MIYAFGDSYVFGEIELNYLKEINQQLYDQIILENDHITLRSFHDEKHYDEFVSLCNEISFINEIGKTLKVKTKNSAVPGSSNFEQIHIAMDMINSGEIRENDHIIFGLTETKRDTFRTRNNEKYILYDLYKILFIMNSLHKKTFFVNLFCNHNVVYELMGIMNNFKVNQNNFLEFEKRSNSCFDILTDNFGNDDIKKTIEYFYSFIYQENFDMRKQVIEHYKSEKNNFQERLHPTKKGHQKISNFLLKHDQFTSFLSE